MAKKPEHRGTFTRAQSQRQLRVGENIRRALAQILQRDGLHDPALAQTSITIGEVRSSSDLKTAHIYALPLGGENAPAVIEALNRNASGDSVCVKQAFGDEILAPIAVFSG